MKKLSNTIVFFGSGPVAAKSLVLLAERFTIEAVVTKPRARHHKGDVPVIEQAERLRLPITTTPTKQTLDDIFAGKPFSSQIAVLIDFGIIVSQKVIDYFPLGIINSHFSLLPEWRGADPITFSILGGQKKTGVSLMVLTAGMDEGPLLGYGEYPLSPSITTPQLTDDLIALSDALITTILPKYICGEIVPQPQNPSVIPTLSRKLTKADGVIDWQKPATQIEREIRAFIEWPKSHAIFAGMSVIITAAHVADASGQPGTTVIINKQLIIYCGQHALAIDRLKPANKKEMDVQAFLAGYNYLFTPKSNSEA